MGNTSREYFYSSAPFLREEDFQRLCEIYRMDYLKHSDHPFRIMDYASVTEDTLPEWIRWNTIPHVITVNNQELEVSSGLYCSSGLLIEISSKRIQRIDDKYAREIGEAGIPAKDPYTRLARIKVIGDGLYGYNWDTKYLDAVLAQHRVYRANPNEKIMDEFMLENLAKLNS